MSRTKLEMVSRDRSFNTPCGVAVLRQHRKVKTNEDSSHGFAIAPHPQGLPYLQARPREGCELAMPARARSVPVGGAAAALSARNRAEAGLATRAGGFLRAAVAWGRRKYRELQRLNDVDSASSAGANLLQHF